MIWVKSILSLLSGLSKFLPFVGTYLWAKDRVKRKQAEDVLKSVAKAKKIDNSDDSDDVVLKRLQDNARK